jgi:hypothetical protein
MQLWNCAGACNRTAVPPPVLQLRPCDQIMQPCRTGAAEGPPEHWSSATDLRCWSSCASVWQHLQAHVSNVGADGCSLNWQQWDELLELELVAIGML